MVLNNINLKIEQGNIYGLIGENGSGKTMLLRAMCDLIKPTKGEILRKSGITYGVIIDNPGFMYEHTGLFNLEYLASINNKISTDRIMECVNMLGLENVINRKVKQYSLGMQQKLGIIQAIMEFPDILLLDEPFNALDVESCEKVWYILKELNEKYKTTIVISTHDQKYVDLFKNTIYMKNGKIS